MKLAIVGSRDFDNYDYLSSSIAKFVQQNEWLSIDGIVSGGARGADKLAEIYASSIQVPFKVFPADWERYGKSAGYKRNKQIVDYCDIVFAFWDGKSKGTQHTINLARDQGKPAFLFTTWTE